MTPPVGGRRKVRVAGLFVLSATASGALAGFAAGGLWAAVGGGAVGPGFAVAVLVATGVAEAAYRLRGWPAPPRVRRQVPRVWGSLFAPETVAVLYGARLGVGPLTLLNTWAWWAAFVLAAGTGAGGAALVGAVFGGVRTLVVVGVAEWVRTDAGARMARLRRGEAVTWLGVLGVIALSIPVSLSSL